MTNGHVHLSDHAQLFARYLCQIGVRSGGERVIVHHRAIIIIVVDDCGVIVARQPAVGPVQSEIVHGTDQLEAGRRVRSVTLVRRTIVRMNFRVRRLIVDVRRHRSGSRDCVHTDAVASDRYDVVHGRDSHGGRVAFLHFQHATGATRAARTARATFSHGRIRPQIVHHSRTTTHFVSVSFIRRQRRWIALKTFSRSNPENEIHVIFFIR